MIVDDPLCAGIERFGKCRDTGQTLCVDLLTFGTDGVLLGLTPAEQRQGGTAG